MYITGQKGVFDIHGESEGQVKHPKALSSNFSLACSKHKLNQCISEETGPRG